MKKKLSLLLALAMVLSLLAGCGSKADSGKSDGNQKLRVAVQSFYCSSTSRMLLTPVRYMTIRSKPRPKPACLQVP